MWIVNNFNEVKVNLKKTIEEGEKLKIVVDGVNFLYQNKLTFSDIIPRINSKMVGEYKQ